MAEEKIDWSIFDGDPEMTCGCRCGAEFRSHAKSFYTEGRKVITRKPCPQCGRNDNCNQISSDPEIFSIRG